MISKNIIVLLTLAIAVNCYDVDWNNLIDNRLSRTIETPHLPNIQSRIFNGYNVESLDKFAYQAGLIVKSGIYLQWCGGSILSNQWILTAAHCIWQAEAADVYLGFINRLIPSENSQVIRVRANNIFMHQGFDHVHNYYDVGLIRLPTPVKLNKSIQPISLIKMEDADKFDNKKVTISGWGFTYDGESDAHHVLQKATIDILSKNDCQELFHSFGRPTSATNTSTLICSDPKQKLGVCEGDSGGPAVIEMNGKPTQIGVNAFIVYDQRSMCEHVYARMFTRVADYLDWICSISKICPN